MHYTLENIITQSDLEYLTAIFEHGQHIHNQSMDKVLPPLEDPEFLAWCEDLIERRIGIKEKYRIVGDNFYLHSNSYFPHTDAIEDNAWLNIVIPLARYLAWDDQKFIVFDQQWLGPNSTWIGDFSLEGDFYSNKKLTTRPCDSEYLLGATGQEINDLLWKHIDFPHFKKDFFFSLNGTAYSWLPGNVIIFDSKHIHATGKMTSKSKLGLSIRIIKQ